MDFKDRIILVTGSAGFIGSHLCDALIRYQPKKLIMFDNLCQSNIDNIKHLLNDKRVEFVKADIRDYDRVEPLVLQSDYIFHLAAGDVGMSEVSPRVNMETNVLGTFNILQAAKNNKDVRIVYASSGSVVNPSTIYSISKLAAENIVSFFIKEHGLRISALRYHHVFGPRQNIFGSSGVINKFLYKILNDESPIVWGTGEAIKCFTFVEDVVAATLIVAVDDNAIGGIYDVASDTRINIKDLAHLLIDQYASDPGLKPIYTDAKVGENMELTPDTARIKAIGWQPTYTFEEGLDITKRYVEGKIENGR